MSAKWTAIKDEPIPEGNGAYYITDGTRVSFAKRAVQAETEVEKWILAEPEAEHRSIPPHVGAPTHWAAVVPGLPAVKAEDIPEVFEGGPPPRTNPDEKINFPEAQDNEPEAVKVQVVKGSAKD